MDHAPTKKLVPTSDDSPQLILEDYNIDLEESKKSSREFEKKSKILSLGIAMITHVPVSYTHLTLPTLLLV